jgi:hypothetical protein
VATTTDDAIRRELRVPKDVFGKVEAVRGHRSFNAFANRALELYALQEARILAGVKPVLTLVPDQPGEPIPEDQTSESVVEQGELEVDEPRRRQPPRPREEWGSR